MPQRRSDEALPYRATPELERRLAREREVQLTGGRYRATVARAGRWYEAWTDSLPFVYGRPSESLQGALDSLDEEWRRVTEERRAS
jgi:hypothetical protein